MTDTAPTPDLPDLGPLPEPFDYCYEWDGPYGTRKFSAAQHNGMQPHRSVPLYTADQMRTYAADCVRAALAHPAPAAPVKESLTTAPAEPAEPLCACKDRPASQCPGQWEPGCDLGNNPAHVRVIDAPAEPAEPVAWLHDSGHLALAGKDCDFDTMLHRQWVPLYAAQPPQPVQPPTDKDSLTVAQHGAFYKDPDAEPPYAQYARGVNDGFEIGRREALIAAANDAAPQPVQPPATLPDVDELAQHIRWVNGSNKMGAGALAEKLLEWLQARTAQPVQAPPQPLTDEQIDGLRGLDTASRVRFYEHDFYVLSNFSAFRITFEGQTFDTSEAAYHYQRFTKAHDRRAVQYAYSAHDAFRYAQDNKHRQRPDWDDVKVGVMRRILVAKAWQHEYVRRKLLATGDRELVEDSWRDGFWGWGPNRNGQNVLGKLWMEVRAELRAQGIGAAPDAPAPDPDPAKGELLAALAKANEVLARDAMKLREDATCYRWLVENWGRIVTETCWNGVDEPRGVKAIEIGPETLGSVDPESLHRAILRAMQA
jgi:ribA/ribD-fused uncharacterized protein